MEEHNEPLGRSTLRLAPPGAKPAWAVAARRQRVPSDRERLSEEVRPRWGSGRRAGWSRLCSGEQNPRGLVSS